MASIIAWDAGRSFELTVFKHHIQNALVTWVNTYWAVSTASGTFYDLESLAVTLGQFEKAIHQPSVWFDRVEVRTGAHDSDPYSAISFTSFPIPGAGVRVGAQGNDEPLGMALHVGRQALYGREGKLFYRGVLTEGDVWAPSGYQVLANQSQMQSMVTDATVASGLNAYLAGGTDPNLKIMVLGRNGEWPREVLYLTCRGVTVGRKSRYWYNRTPPGENPEYPEVLDSEQLAYSSSLVGTMPEDYQETRIEGEVTTEYDEPVGP